MIHTPESLAAFRDKVAQAFLDKKIRSPVHLPSDTQAKPLLDIFQRFRPGIDWCFSGWRSMWHCLLAGIPEDALFDMILNGRSMFIQSAKHRVFCSSIVGGILPIAAGVAMAIKRNGGREYGPVTKIDGGLMATYAEPQVFCFVGDMTSRCGLFHEFREYCGRHNLPVRIVIEDNGHSTDTPTAAAWGDVYPRDAETWVPTERYSYERQWPHVGVGTHVEF